MKILLCVAATLLAVVPTRAANFRLDGDLTWQITEPRLSFQLDGNLINLTEGTSGTLKLVLWATPQPYPSAGYNLGEFTLGQIDGGYQFTDFNQRTTCEIPAVTGNYHFSITLLEYTTAGWRNRMIIPGGTAFLTAGDFANQPKWKLSSKKVTSPPATLSAGKSLSLKLKATSLLNLLPASSQFTTRLTVKDKARISSLTGDGKRIPKYTYKTVTTAFNKSKVKAGQLTLQYAATDQDPKATEVITLYFQGATSGTFQSVRSEAGDTEATWGGFTF